MRVGQTSILMPSSFRPLCRNDLNFYPSCLSHLPCCGSQAVQHMLDLYLHRDTISLDTNLNVTAQLFVVIFFHLDSWNQHCL